MDSLRDVLYGLIQSSESTDPQVRMNTIGTLEYMISGSIHLLRSMTIDGAMQVADAAVTALANIKDKANEGDSEETTDVSK